MNKKKIVGLVENIVLKGPTDEKKLRAKIDTGATKSSIDSKLAAELNLGPITETKMVKSAHGNTLRPILEADVKIAGKEMRVKFTIADRKHLKYPVLIGQNILKEGFLIDPSKGE